MLDYGSLVKPLPLVEDGDLIALVQYVIGSRGQETVRVTEGKGHAEHVDVQQGRVRLRINWETLRLILPLTWVVVISLKFSLMLDVGCSKFVVVGILFILHQLHRFMIAIAGVSVNHDGRGGTAPDPLVWDQGGPKKARMLDIRVNVDLASLPGPSGFLGGPWMQVHGGCISGADIAAWPSGVGILCKFAAFLGTLHWPAGSDDFCHFSVSFLELLILFEQWTGHRLLSEKVTWPHVRANRPILIRSVPVSEGIEIRHGCQFLSSLIRGPAKLPGGLGRFLPCRLGSHLSRLRHLGWYQCSHCLTSGPLESCHHQCLEAVCDVLG